MGSTEDQVLFARLLGAITIDGAVESTSDGIIITTFEGRVLPQPMRIHVTPSSFGPLLRNASSESAGAFPDVGPLEAAWRLFLVHLDEAIQTVRPGETELVPVSYGIESFQQDMTRAPITHEQQEHRDDQRRYDQLINYFADRGRVEVELEAQTIVIHEINGSSLPRALRLRVPYDALSDRLRRHGEPDSEWSVLVAEVEERIRAGWADIELRADGTIHVRS